MQNTQVSKKVTVLDSILFPIRALFIPENSRLGLTSLRDERFLRVAKYCKGTVLDIGCGRDNLFIKNYAQDSNSVGIDVYQYGGVTTVIEDMEKLPYSDNSFDTITLIAVGGHIPKDKRTGEFKEFARILKPGGHLIMTEGEPITQTIGHKWRHISYAMIGKQDMDSERGMEEEEEYCMPKEELMTYLNQFGLKLKAHEKFMWGLNNVYVSEKILN